MYYVYSIHLSTVGILFMASVRVIMNIILKCIERGIIQHLKVLCTSGRMCKFESYYSFVTEGIFPRINTHFNLIYFYLFLIIWTRLNTSFRLKWVKWRRVREEPNDKRDWSHSKSSYYSLKEMPLKDMYRGVQINCVKTEDLQVR